MNLLYKIVFTLTLFAFGVFVVHAVITTSGNFPTSINYFEDGDIINAGDWNNIEETIGETSTTSRDSLFGRWNDYFSSTTTLPTNITTASGLTTIGTIGTGVWQGSIIDAAYLDTSLALFAWTFVETGKVSTSTELHFGAGFVSQASSTIDGTLTMTGGITMGVNSITGISNSTYTPSSTGTLNVIDITPSGAMAASTMWHGLDIDGSALDPSDFGVEIDGIRIDFTGIDETKTPIIHGLDIRVPFGNDGLHISQGELHMNVLLPNIAGATFTSIDVVVDGSGSPVTADYHALDVALTNGSLSSIAAVGTHSGVRVIDQHIVSSFSTPDQGEYAGRKTGGGSTWADGIDTIEIFIVNSDEVYIGNTSGAGQFSEIQVVMGTPGTKSVIPTFWYNTAADTWTQFFPADDTDGFQQNGIIRWDLAGISASWTNNGDPGGVNASTGYWIKIIRTGTPDPGTPTATTMKTGIVVKYYWDENGNLSIKDISADGNIYASSTQFITADSNDLVFRMFENSGGEYFDIQVDSSGDLKFLTDAGAIALELRDVGAHLVKTNGTIQIANGTISNPTLTFINATDDGFYRLGGDVMGFVVGGSNTFLIGSASTTILGNLTIDSSGSLICDGCVDGDDINSNYAGAYLTETAGSPDVLDVDVELYTFAISANLFATSTADGISTTTEAFISIQIPVASTITRFTCYTDDSGTATIRASISTDGISAGSDILYSTGTDCSSGSETATTTFENTAIGARDWIHIWTDDAEPTGSRPRVIYVSFEAIKND